MTSKSLSLCIAIGLCMVLRFVFGFVFFFFLIDFKGGGHSSLSVVLFPKCLKEPG